MLRLLLIYRAIDVEVERLNLNQLGIAWSWLQDDALRYGNKIMLIGQVDESMVDWPLTVALNAHHEQDRSIMLYHQSPVLIQAIHSVETGLDITPVLWQGYIAKA